MKVLILGGAGFIGSAIVKALIAHGMTVSAAVRDPVKLHRRFPTVDALAVDLRSPAATDPGFWRERLDGVEAVINAAGVLSPRRTRDAWAVHRNAPAALYDACEAAGVKRVIQISAVGVEEAETLFARSKRAADEALMSRALDWTVLRPAVVVGDGSYGGTSMLRAIAAFPGATPVIGDGETALDFIHKDDLAEAIVAMLQSDATVGQCLEPASADRMSMTEAVSAYRSWLGLAPRPVIRVPRAIAFAVAKFGDLVRLEPITTTALAQFEGRLTGDAKGFEAATGVEARGLRQLLAGRPAESQDLWHARLYLLRPIIRLTLALLWIVSGIAGLTADPSLYLQPFSGAGLPAEAIQAAVWALSFFDFAIALALVCGWRLRQMAVLQLAAVLAYTVGLTLTAPALWLDLYGGLLKNLPILALLAVHWTLEVER